MCVWSVEADIFNFDNDFILNLLYRNSCIDRFLNSKISMGIAACKGMGKTFLLKTKRLKIMQDKSILTLPKDRMVDASGSIVLQKFQIQFLSSYNNWISIWTSCIAVYLLSLDEFSNVLQYETENTNYPESVLKLMKKKYIGIFNVLHMVLSGKSKKELNEFVRASSLLFDALQRINEQVAIFVDKLEEPFNRGYYQIPGESFSAQGRYNMSIWAYSQLAFAEAVYQLCSNRNHIKIYYSIRKEALFHGEQISTEYQKLRDRIVTIRYTEHDLYNMFATYVANENPNELCCPEYILSNPVKALVGIDTISHRSGAVETIWNYIYRHTFQRPRDIMEMCQSIHTNIVKDDKVTSNSISRTKILRHWINEISTMECMSYLQFLDPFMKNNEKSDDIYFKDKILLFSRFLSTSIFTSESIKWFCQQFKEQNSDSQECYDINYFSVLYNIGLLGYIHQSTNDKTYTNHIQHIGQSSFNIRSTSLPKGVIYYLHPGLSNIVQRERELTGLSFTPCQYVLNDLNNCIPYEHVGFMENSIISTISNLNDRRVFLSSTGRDFNDERKRIVKILEDKGYEVLAFEMPNFPEMPIEPYDSGSSGKTHDHCIDVMLTCKHVIYIFTGRFGGEYKGRKYVPYYEKESIIKITPSVSFMEYLVGKNHLKNVKVYVDEKVDIARGEYIANGRPSDYESQVVDNTKVFDQLGYFNGLGNGTWYDKFSDTISLEEYIKAHFQSI